ncbi:glucose PTS transporter transcription antiterminator GlcT [Peribacillus deserti]|uniref:Transcriptional antiterminator n=1 Tax=Peribacillus deserti TaxID=673318 RepID=A0A2N5LZM3_9BACI|nr:transcription antiterminator [Peribacillus deserti]PLT27515.1 transcriptional antiterminator [Peribacillus deserti]
MISIEVKKVLNNNVLIASHPRYEEVIMIGKGIGFNRKKGEVISAESAEKMFVLKNENEQENYKKLLPLIEEPILSVIIEAIDLIKRRVRGELNEHIHVGLTDHLTATIHRINEGINIRNPFLDETKTLYPSEFDIAEEVVELIQARTGVSLPEAETGFITLHIHSAITNKQVSEINQHSQLIASLIAVVEEQFDMSINKASMDYMRLVRHLRFAIERVLREEKVEEPEKISTLLQEEYPVCYNLAWKLIKIMQNVLKKPVFDAEAVYLTMHLQRLQRNN